MCTPLECDSMQARHKPLRLRLCWITWHTFSRGVCCVSNLRLSPLTWCVWPTVPRLPGTDQHQITWWHSNRPRCLAHVGGAALFVAGDASCACPAVSPTTRSSCTHTGRPLSSHRVAAGMGAPPTLYLYFLLSYCIQNWGPAG